MTPDPGYELRCLDDAESVCREGAEEFIRAAGHAIAAREKFRVALSGGSTPRRLHEILASSPCRERVDWKRVEFFFGDERSVPPDHPDANYRMAEQSLFEKLEISGGQIHRMHAEREDRDAAALDYQMEIASSFGTESGGPTPRFDLILLGMGTDGHTASLFPETEALGESDCWVANNEVPQLGVSRMTFTFPLINRAERVVFLIAGHDKARALAAVLDGPEDLTRYPAQGVRPEPGSLLLLIDRAAGERLRRT